jgi:hypothetical protein
MVGPQVRLICSSDIRRHRARSRHDALSLSHHGRRGPRMINFRAQSRVVLQLFVGVSKIPECKQPASSFDSPRKHKGVQ